MRVRVLGGSGGLSPDTLLTSFRIDQNTLIDAGSVAQALSIEEQAQISHVFLTHAHLDHSGHLPFLVDNIFGMRDHPFVIHSGPESLQGLRDHLFNGTIWPDFSRIPDFASAPMRFHELAPEVPVCVNGLKVTPVPVHHTIPALGFIVEDDDSSILFSGDTAATERLWALGRELPNLQAAFIECSFPDRMQAITDASGHLSPQTLARELRKLGREVPVFVYHVKPRFHAEVVEELKGLGRENLQVVEQGAEYVFARERALRPE